MKVLKGQKMTDAEFESIERQLNELFYRVIFKPMVNLLAPHNAQVRAAKSELRNSKELRNAKFDLIVSAINSGRVQYDMKDTFSGEFSAAISKALRSYGAKFDKRTSTFVVLPQNLPVEVLKAAKDYAATAKKLHDELDRTLDSIQRAMEGKKLIDQEMGNEGMYKATKAMIAKQDKKFNQQYGDALGTTEMSHGSQVALAKTYQASLTPYVQKFSNDMVIELRQIVSDNARTGYRFDSLIDRLQNRFNVTRSKAAFLARQETSLFVSKAREARFGDVGITSYVWQTAGDAEVRPDHKKLDGMTFEYARPPVVDAATGSRGNPGEDFNCRCVSAPVLPGVLTNA